MHEGRTLYKMEKGYTHEQRTYLENHGGQYIPETLMNAVSELEEAYNIIKKDPQFQRRAERPLK